MLPIVCITQEGQDHLSLTPFLFKSSKKSLSESVMLCNTANILASHVAVCHNLILVSCGLQSSAQEESEISITEVSKRHDFRCKFKHSHEHRSLNVYWQWKDTGNEKVSSKTSMIVSIQKTKSQTAEKNIFSFPFKFRITSAKDYGDSTLFPSVNWFFTLYNLKEQDYILVSSSRMILFYNLSKS